MDWGLQYPGTVLHLLFPPQFCPRILEFSSVVVSSPSRLPLQQQPMVRYLYPPNSITRGFTSTKLTCTPPRAQPSQNFVCTGGYTAVLAFCWIDILRTLPINCYSDPSPYFRICHEREANRPPSSPSAFYDPETTTDRLIVPSLRSKEEIEGRT